MFRHPLSPRPGLLQAAMGLALVAVLVVPGSALAGRSQVIKVDAINLDCELESADAVASLSAVLRDRSDGNGFGFVDLFVDPNDPGQPALGGGMDDPALTTSGLQASFDVADDATGEPIGTATVAASFTTTHSERFHLVYENLAQVGIYYLLSVSGTVEVTAGGATYTFDMAGCDATASARSDLIHAPSGPKPGGKVPANDTAAGAIHIAPGDIAQMQTTGASPASEAPCLIASDEEVFEVEFGRTVWFSITGTGGPVTIDPAGSNFDTVVAAYVDPGTGLDQVGCVDDGSGPLGTPKQAALTIDTELGRTYLIQVGGVVGDLGSDIESGRLRLRVS